MKKVLDINDLLGRIQTALIEGLYILSVTDKNTFIEETLELKIEQAKTYNKIYASAERGLAGGFIDENMKENIQQKAMESLTELEASVQKILSTLHKQNQEQLT